MLELGFGLASAREPELELAAESHWIVTREGERISAQVRQLTGFHESVLENALAPEEAWRRLRALTGGVTFVPTAIHYPKPLHRQEAYRHFPTAGNGLPVSELLAGEVISLPMHPYLEPPVQDRIVAAVRDSLAHV